MREFLTSLEVAKIFGVSDRSVRRWAVKGLLKGIKVGKQFRFEHAVVEAARTNGVR